MLHSNYNLITQIHLIGLKFNMKNKAGLSVSVRIFGVENIVNVCKACMYIRTLLRTF